MSRVSRASRVTIHEVAAAAGVSRQTVTRALNDMSEISVATRERVLLVARDLGYRPSRFAANMPRQKSVSVGLVICSLRNPYFTDLAADVLDILTARGWHTVLCPAADSDCGTGTSSSTSSHTVLGRLTSQVDAVIGYLGPADEAAVLAAAPGIPIVSLERRSSTPGVDSVTLDFDQGVADLVAGLRERGGRRFGLIESRAASGNGQTPSPRRRRFEELVDTESAGAVVEAKETIAGGAEAFEQLVRCFPDTDTVIAFNDLMAMGAVQAARQLGLAVPGDVRIAGIDGLSLGAVMNPALTTLAIDRPGMAAAAVDLLDRAFDRTLRNTMDRDRPAGQAGDEFAGQVRVVVPHPVWRASA